MYVLAVQTKMLYMTLFTSHSSGKSCTPSVQAIGELQIYL